MGAAPANRWLLARAANRAQAANRTQTPSRQPGIRMGPSHRESPTLVKP